MIYQLLYASSAITLLEQEDLKQILQSSRRNNPKSGITGLLLYQDGNFIQLLEGNKEAVKQTYDRIAEDERHAGLLILSERFHEERLFPEWAMGFRDAGELANLPGFSDFLANDMTPASFQDDPDRIAVLLSTFKEFQGMGL